VITFQSSQWLNDPGFTDALTLMSPFSIRCIVKGFVILTEAPKKKYIVGERETLETNVIDVYLRHEFD
jgi:hypothetical protein